VKFDAFFPCAEFHVSTTLISVSFRQYRACVTDTFLALKDGECTGLYDDLIKCNGRYEYDYGKKCKQVRDSLQMCAIKNKLGELGKSYAM
jgi:hypothetical protein